MTRVAITDCGEDRLGPYTEALRQVGLDPVLLKSTLPFDRNDLEMLDLRGLVLTGGTDLNPATYGEIPVTETDPPDNRRDALEFEALAGALQRHFPVLAICRGMQTLNVFLGGTLHQHLPSTKTHRQRFPEDPPGQHRAVHDVEVIPGTRLATVAGTAQMEVNSRHHQAVARVGSGLRVAARSLDGSAVIEAVEMPEQRFVLAVQWHPEDRIIVSPSDLRLFTAFAEECVRT